MQGFKFLSVILSIAVCATEVRAICPEPFTELGNQCYYFSQDSAGWTEAREICKFLSLTHEVDLAMLDMEPNDYENIAGELVRLGGEHGFWLGGTRDSKDAAKWNWLDGRPMDLTQSYWADGNPTPDPAQNCIFIMETSDQVWQVADTYFYGGADFICQLGAEKQV